MDCFCEFENPCEHVLVDKKRKCRKPRRCCECGTMIERGELYAYFCGVWEGRLDAYSTCEKCDDLRKRCEFACAGFGGIGDQVSQSDADDIEVLAFMQRLHRYQMETNEKYRQQAESMRSVADAFNRVRLLDLL